VVFLFLATFYVTSPSFAESQSLVINDSARGPLAKSKALDQLKKTRETQSEQIAKLDQEIKTKISETQNIHMALESASQERAFDNKLQAYVENLNSFAAKRSELLLRQKLVDQIIFQIDTKWNGQGLRGFLEHIFLDMALSEMTDEAPDVVHATFYSYMSVALREMPEPTEDLISFMIGYMNYSSISKPRSPLSYMSLRNYSNGTTSVTARAAKADSINQLIEKRLKIVEELKTSPAKDSANETNKEQEESFDETKMIRTKTSDKMKPSAAIINFAPSKLSGISEPIKE